MLRYKRKTIKQQNNSPENTIIQVKKQTKTRTNTGLFILKIMNHMTIKRGRRGLKQSLIIEFVEA